MELIALGRLGRGAPAVVPGPERAPEVACQLCSDDGLVTYVVVGHVDTAVCVDSRACVKRALGAEVGV